MNLHKKKCWYINIWILRKAYYLFCKFALKNIFLDNSECDHPELIDVGGATKENRYLFSLSSW